MEIRELRIGNFVTIDNDMRKSQTGDVFVVEAIENHSANNKSISLSSCDNGSFNFGQLQEFVRPIPLTEEWLIKLGCRRVTNGFWLPMTNLKAELHFGIHGKEVVTSIESDFSCLILDPVKYVHSLQNLYYSLTGRELELAPSPDLKRYYGNN